MKKAPDTTQAASSAPDTAQFTGTELLALAFTAIENAALRAWCATPSSWGRGTIATDAQKHHGFGSPVTEGAAAAPNLDSGFFTPMRCAWHTWLSFLAGRVGAPARVRRFLRPVFQPCTVCHPRLEAGAAGLKPVPKEPSMANTPQGRTAPTPPVFDPVATHFEAVNCLAMARWYAARYQHTKAARKAVQGLSALRKLQAFERAETTSTSPAVPASACTGCRDNFPLPNGPLDFFDAHVVADYIQRRSACTLRPAASKPCMKGGAA